MQLASFLLGRALFEGLPLEARSGVSLLYAGSSDLPVDIIEARAGGQCGIGFTVCGAGCMPIGNVCCDGKGYCHLNEYCTNDDGCCPVGYQCPSCSQQTLIQDCRIRSLRPALVQDRVVPEK
jgi:hypothetical protein